MGQARIDEHSTKIELSETISLRLDAEGRWGSYRRGPEFFRRTMRDEVWCRSKELSIPERGDLDSEIKRTMHTTRKALLAGTLSVMGAEDKLLDLLDLGLALDEDVIDRQALFDRAYAESVPILPPDRYRDLVILPATGCPNGQCSFCAFYKDSIFRPFTLIEFEKHLENLNLLLGRAIHARDGIFLGSANALALPDKKLLPMLEQIHNHIGPRKRGIASFFDPEHAPSRDFASWQQLEDLDLRQVVLGLETANPDLRKSLGKTHDLDLIDRCLDNLCQTNIRVGLTLLLGAGPEESADSQLDQASRYLASLPLRSTDLIYLSPLSDSTWSDPQSHFAPWRKTLRASTPAQLVHYSMDRFHYYA